MIETRDRRNKESADFIMEFYELVKDDYPNLSYSQVDKICRNNFKMMKAEMEAGTLKTIRMRFVGTFVVHKGRAKGMLNKTEKMFEDGKITVDILTYIRRIVKNFLKREYNEDLPRS